MMWVFAIVGLVCFAAGWLVGRVEKEIAPRIARMDGELLGEIEP